MAYSYELCFWDPHDEGVNVLLGHISAGIKSCGTMVTFFKQRSELEKDYARRLGAMSSRMVSDMEESPEYGRLNECFQTVVTNERTRAQAHSKQSELMYRQIYSDVKAFAGKMQARYTTLSGKTERLRVDKYNKRKGCEDLTKKLEEAEIRARDLRLNQNNVIGNKKGEQNRRELAKWDNNSREISLQLDVLKQEYRASQKYWFKEWAEISAQLQEMETARISYLQAKIQQFAQVTLETSLLEQSKMDSLMNQLATFTPADDISEFSSGYGTGRLKEKRKVTNDLTGFDVSRGKKDLHAENIRKLSSQLQRQSLGDSRLDKELPTVTVQRQPDLETRKPPRKEPFSHSEPPLVDRKEELSPYSRQRGQSPHKPTSSSSSASSSVPTDFTAHVKNRHSIDSMATSVSSMASSIDDSQRFAKSWNSSNRKRKSMSHLQQDRTHEDPSPSPVGHRSEESLRDSPALVRNSSADTTIMNTTMASQKNMRRKSMVLQDSSNPIEDALYEMERIKSMGSSVFARSDARVGRVRDNGITITLPTVTSEGEPVIKYAKAVYPLLDNDAAELAHFEKGDYLLLTATINEDWFRGEVYDNNFAATTHKNGLIPYNFIQLLN